MRSRVRAREGPRGREASSSVRAAEASSSVRAAVARRFGGSAAWRKVKPSWGRITPFPGRVIGGARGRGPKGGVPGAAGADYRHVGADVGDARG